MVRDTPPSQDVSTYQIWSPYLKESRRYAPDTKRDGRMDGLTDRRRTDGRTVQLLYASQSSFGGIKTITDKCEKIHNFKNSQFYAQESWNNLFHISHI